MHRALAAWGAALVLAALASAAACTATASRTTLWTIAELESQ
jgi:hypothetical protein